MKLSDIIEALIKSGAGPDIILAAIRAAEKSEEDECERKRELVRNRVRKHREKITHCNDSDHVTVKCVTERYNDESPLPLSSPSSSSPPHPPNNYTPIIPQPPTAKTRRAAAAKTKINDDFEPNENGKEICCELKLDPMRCAEQFVDYWKSRGVSRADWQATFRNSVRGYPDMYRRQGAGTTSGAVPFSNGNGGQNQRKPVSVCEVGMRVAARFAEQERRKLEPSFDDGRAPWDDA